MPHSSPPFGLTSDNHPLREAKHIRPSPYGRKAYSPLVKSTPDLYAAMDFDREEPKRLLDVPDIRQPDDFSCILPGQVLQGRVIGASKAWYSGKAIKIRTARGASLSVTPNHPIMTSEGFVPAGQLQEGCYLLNYVGEDHAASSSYDKEHAPSFVENVFQTLSDITRPVSPPEKVATTAFDFHGDSKFFKGNVEVVGSYSKLWCNIVSQSFKGMEEGGLVRVGSDKVSLTSRSSFDLSFLGSSGPARSIVSAGDLSSPFFFGHLAPLGDGCSGEFISDFCFVHRQLGCLRCVSKNDPVLFESCVDDAYIYASTAGDLFGGFPREVSGDQFVEIRNNLSVPRFGPASCLNTPLSEYLVDELSADTVLARKLLDSHSNDVVLDKIISIEEFHYEGPVYDFESPLGYIIVENLCISNCGACCAMSVGKYWGVGPDDLEEWKKALGTNRKTSTHPYAIRDYLKSLGLQVNDKHEMTIEDLYKCWEEGLPVIIPLQEYGDPVEDEKHEEEPKKGPKAEFPYGHYCTVVGVGLGQVFVSDPSIDNVMEGEQADYTKGKMMIPVIKFLKVWHDKDLEGDEFIRYGIIVGPPSGKREKALPHLPLKKTPRSGPPITGGPVIDSPYPRRQGTFEGPDAYEFNSPETRVKKLEQPKEYSCLMLRLEDPEALSAIKEIHKNIAPEDLTDDGIETDPHVTLLWGMEFDKPQEVYQAIHAWLRVTGKQGIRVFLGDISVFPAGDPENVANGQNFDVLKLDVLGDDIQELHQFLAEKIPHTDTHEEFTPHVTLAYLVPGMSWLYVGDGLGGKEVILTKATFSDRGRNHTPIPLMEDPRIKRVKQLTPDSRLEGQDLEPRKTSNAEGWRAEELPGEWGLLSAGSTNEHMEAPGGLTTISNQEEWERENSDRWGRSEETTADIRENVRPSPFGRKTRSKSSEGNDYRVCVVDVLSYSKSATHLDYPQIPKKEIWLNKNLNLDEARGEIERQLKILQNC